MDSKESGNSARGPTPHIIPTTHKKHLEQDPQSSEGEDEDEDAYMPALPPHLLKETAATARHTPGNRDSGSKQNYKNSKNRENSDNKSGQHSKTDNHSSDSDSQATIDKRPLDSESDDEDDMYGPALPPHLLNKKLCNSSPSARKNIVGPSLPVGFVPPKEVPVVPEDKEEEEDDDDDSGPIIGPAPPTQAFNEEEYRIRQLELRAKKMKDKLEGKDVSIDKAPVRESWMLELPEDKANFCGLGARQFLRKTPAVKGDRSVWTDTPADKARKAQNQRESESPLPEQEETIETIATSRRDLELSEAVDNYNKNKRAKPLIELHQKKLKKKEKESGPKERVPFSREEDMNVNKFDEAQKSNILKKARQLNDRFSEGNKKFL